MFGGHEAASDEEFITQDTEARIEKTGKDVGTLGGQLAAREEEVARRGHEARLEKTGKAV